MFAACSLLYGFPFYNCRGTPTPSVPHKKSGGKSCRTGPTFLLPFYIFILFLFLEARVARHKILMAINKKRAALKSEH